MATIDLTDTGLLREATAQDLADWLAAGMIGPAKAASILRRAKILAARTGLPYEAVWADLMADADEINATGTWSRA